MWTRNPDSSGYPSQGRKRFILAPILIAIAIVIFQYLSADTFTNPETGKSAHVGLSTEQENALGLQSFQQVLSQSQTIDSGPQYDQVVKVVENLIQQVDPESRKFEWSVSLIESDQENAFCLPGGKIAVYTGILPIAKNDDGLATILGHEIAHATSRHGAQRIFQQQMAQTAMNGVNGSLGDMDMGQRRIIMGLLGAGVQYGVLMPYGREHELEADEIGLKYMMRAGYNPQEAISFWQRMQAQNKQHPSEWLSTHPSNDSRIARLKEIIAQESNNTIK